MTLHALCEWLAATPWSVALHESLYAYPLVESAHVLSLMLFVGSVWWVDLRLLGWTLRDVPVSEVTARVLPWTVAGFCIALVTGALLFYAIPVRTFHSVFFRAKLLLFVVAAINIVAFHLHVRRSRVAWDHAPTPPPRVRLAGAVSLFAWAGVIVMGRMIAYDWFDCDRPQPDVVVWAAGCIEEP